MPRYANRQSGPARAHTLRVGRRTFAGSSPAVGTAEKQIDGSVGNWQTTLARAPTEGWSPGCCGFDSHLSHLQQPITSSWSSGVLACLSRRRSWVQIPSGTLEQDGAVRKPVKRRSSNLRDRLWVRLPPVLLNGSCSSRLPVKQLSENKRGGRREVQFLHDPLTTTRPVLLTAGCEPLKLAIRVQVPYGLLTQPSGGTGIRATLRPSCPLGHASSTLALATDIAGAAGAQSGFISPTSPARYRDLQLDMLRVGQCSFGPHKPGPPGATPGPATLKCEE